MSNFPNTLLVAALLFAAVPAHAQDGAIDMTGMGIYADEEAVMDAARETSSARTKSRTTTRSFGYVPTAALRQQTVHGVSARLKASNPALAQAVNTTFGPGKTDYNQVYEGIIKGSGLRNNDAAAALTAYMLMNWMVVHNVQDGNAITVPMARGLQAQVAPLLAGKQLTPAAAAQLGEEMKLQTSLLFITWNAAMKKGQLAGFRQDVASAFRQQYRMDLSQLKLTSQGFVK